MTCKTEHELRFDASCDLCRAYNSALDKIEKQPSMTVKCGCGQKEKVYLVSETQLSKLRK